MPGLRRRIVSLAPSPVGATASVLVLGLLAALGVTGLSGVAGGVGGDGMVEARTDRAATHGAALSASDRVGTASSAQPAADGVRRGGRARAVRDAMTLAQRVGQLFVAGTPATSASAETRRLVRELHVGNVMLTGRSYDGRRAPARVARAMQAEVGPRSTRGVRLLVAADQEGGYVQALQGGAFDRIPTALQQGRLEPATLRERARRWARQLREAGVSLNLAPVLDTVPSPAAARRNPPIGAFDRQYGFRPRRVAAHGTAFARAMADGRVAAAIKHFPGLGRVTENTDTDAGVTDRVTRRDDPYLRPFARAVRAGAPVVMMSSAIYSRIDRGRPALFSRRIVTRVLRGNLGFAGVVMTDDVAATRQLARWSPAARALKFLRAGGDLVLSVQAGPVPEMVRAVLAQARSDRAFRAHVNRSALRVLRLKQRLRLLGDRQ